MEIWHKRLKELRQNTDVTLKDMAKIIGVSEATVQRYENGSIAEIPYKAITAYAKKFKVNPSYIMGWTNTPNQNTLFDIVSKDEVSDYFESAMRATIESHKKAASDEESIIIECYRDLSENEKNMVKRMIGYYERLKTYGKDVHNE